MSKPVRIVAPCCALSRGGPTASASRHTKERQTRLFHSSSSGTDLRTVASTFRHAARLLFLGRWRPAFEHCSAPDPAGSWRRSRAVLLDRCAATSSDRASAEATCCSRRADAQRPATPCAHLLAYYVPPRRAHWVPVRRRWPILTMSGSAAVRKAAWKRSEAGTRMIDTFASRPARRSTAPARLRRASVQARAAACLAVATS